MTDADQDQGQPLVAHLTELRDRLLRVVLAVLVCAVGLMPFANTIYSFVAEPLRRYLPEGTSMIATEIASPFLTPFKLVLVSAFCMAMPVILHQIWQFVAPGMYRHEKRIAAPLLASSVILFYAGLAFAYYVVFPLVFGFFSGITPEGVNYTPDIARFLDTALKLFLAFGIAFEIPIATVLLIASGVTSAEDLAAKRPYVIIGCFVFGMLLTPPDVISQALLAVPMWFLFEVGIVFGRLVKKKQAESDV
ncbi:twin arginine-targeting protein translocase TatC [gamma proteobacterium BDW918]|uniref:Sec-independent protein translocase protein TatC n=1 Tax=Zhongshania aliphaticivorans TaxID=1470434 RepID=A0A127M2T4_9GAMM|nr:twin-arginine translocase subunit TatC [Zhongshania aliphaticivorans]AMO67549.1 twin-arginine protein translocation system subunit TatC [Zhongshania aliphaticivorans]EIF44998.1 twin arginine-targeting protein translocase TatC [gamma proteobacterium BDW918]